MLDESLRLEIARLRNSRLADSESGGPSDERPAEVESHFNRLSNLLNKLRSITDRDPDINSRYSSLSHDFEMLVIAITEQQISLAAAYRIRTRIIERFGDHVNGLWAFPTPRRLSESSTADLMRCGLSQRKAEYVEGLAAFYLLAYDRLFK